MPYSLVRERDGAGDSGPVSSIYRVNPETNEVEWINNSKPKVGWGIQVGSLIARTYAAQDFWQTTEVVEILEETEDCVKFRTLNSIYEWTQF